MIIPGNVQCKDNSVKNKQADVKRRAIDVVLDSLCSEFALKKAQGKKQEHWKQEENGTGNERTRDEMKREVCESQPWEDVVCERQGCDVSNRQ